MKKLILFVSLVAVAYAHAQTTGGVRGPAIDYSNNPTGQAFGGAMGGGNTPAATVPTSPANTNTSPSVNRDLSVPRGTDLPQQRMEDIGGETRAPKSTIPPATSFPADTPVAPAVPKANTDLPQINGSETNP